MTRQRVDRAVRGALVVALGAVGLTSPVPASAWHQTVPDCLGAPSVVAWLGLHARVLVADASCPHGSYAPTGSYQSLAQTTAMACLTVLVLGLASLCAATGVGIYATATLREVRVWFGHRFGVVVAALTVVVVPSGRPAAAPVRVRVAETATRQPSRRGPPPGCC